MCDVTGWQERLLSDESVADGVKILLVRLRPHVYRTGLLAVSAEEVGELARDTRTPSQVVARFRCRCRRWHTLSEPVIECACGAWYRVEWTSDRCRVVDAMSA